MFQLQLWYAELCTSTTTSTICWYAGEFLISKVNLKTFLMNIYFLLEYVDINCNLFSFFPFFNRRFSTHNLYKCSADCVNSLRVLITIKWLKNIYSNLPLASSILTRIFIIPFNFFRLEAMVFHHPWVHGWVSILMAWTIIPHTIRTWLMETTWGLPHSLNHEDFHLMLGHDLDKVSLTNKLLLLHYHNTTLMNL